MQINRTLRSAALALAAAACHLAAADVHWGATAGLGFPASDLKEGVDSRKGLTLGAQATIPLGHNHAIRPRLDIARFSSPWMTDGTLRYQGSVDTVKLGADYIYAFQGASKGPYVFCGLGGVANRADVDVEAPGLPRTSFSETVNKAYAQVGAGYQINRNWGVEAYHTRHRQIDDDLYSAFMVAVTARF